VSFKAFIPSSAPNWLQGINGTKLLEAIGVSFDRQINATREAVLVRFPNLAPSDGLPAIGNERRLERGALETEADYRARVYRAWDDWALAGGGQSLLRVLRSQGYPNTALVQQNGILYTLDGPGNVLLSDLGANPLLPGSPPWWTFTNNDLFWNRFAVIFYPPFPFSWTSIVSPPTSVSAPSDSEIGIIARAVTTWKPGKALCMGIFVLLDGQSIGYPVRIIGNGTTIVPFGSINGGAVVRFDC